MEFHLISNGRMEIGNFSKLVGSLAPHVDFIHLREKHRSARELSEAITRLKEQGVPVEKLIVNDRVDVAVVERVKGVQLANHSINTEAVRTHFPSVRIGKSVHSGEEALQAQKAGANYVLFGHIFSTESKPGVEPRGLSSLRDVVQSVSIPVIGIGGIIPENVKDVMGTGAAGIAVMSGVLEAQNPYQAVHEYKKGWSS